MNTSMNKTLLIAAVALVFASSFAMIASNTIQLAHACPGKGTGTAAPNANPITPSNLNAQLPPPPTSQPATGQIA
jgi:hypothetical protein